MIVGLDHVVVLTGDIAAGEAAYQSLFGRTPAWRNSGDGAERILFTLDNMSLELMAPSGEGAAADRIRAVLAAQGEGRSPPRTSGPPRRCWLRSNGAAQ